MSSRPRNFYQQQKNKWRHKKPYHKPAKAIEYPAEKPGEVWYTVHTDGSALNNPGPGGYGAVVRLGDTKITLSKGFTKTTNNRMEIWSVIALLEEFGPNKRFNVYLDSEYTMNGATRWIPNWQRNNWMTSLGEPVKNRDLWIQLYDLMKENEVRFHKVKAHTGVPDNEEADQLAKAAAGTPTETDTFYEQSIK